MMRTLTMRMTAELDQARDYYRNQLTPPEKLKVMDRATEELIASGRKASTLRGGDHVDDFILMDAHGEAVRLQSLLEAGPVVISFYRGGWCPYCTIELRGLQRALPEINGNGATIVAISPQLPDNSFSTEEKNKLTFPILSDVGNVIARRFGIVFRLPIDLLDAYKAFNHELLVMNGEEGSTELPISRRSFSIRAALSSSPLSTRTTPSGSTPTPSSTLFVPCRIEVTTHTSGGNRSSMVPVGTLITERPPDGSVRARLRIRLL
jgi:peroxiredoxin